MKMKKLIEFLAIILLVGIFITLIVKISDSEVGDDTGEGTKPAVTDGDTLPETDEPETNEPEIGSGEQETGEPEPEGYTVSGKYYLNSSPDCSFTPDVYDISFTYNDIQFVGFRFLASPGVLIGYETPDRSGGTWIFDMTSTSGSYFGAGGNEIDFGTEPQTVSEDFYNWLLANGSFEE